VLIALVLRAVAGWATVEYVLGDRTTRHRWWLIPLQDLLQFLVWVLGFFGNTILWRGRKYYLLADGRFERRRQPSAIGHRLRRLFRCFAAKRVGKPPKRTIG
jgi:hypothetical protein